MSGSSAIAFLRRSVLVAASLLGVAAGCGHGGPKTAVPSARARTSDTLMVMIPGRGDDADAFEREGFVELLREAGADTDYVLVPAPRHLRRPNEFTRMLHHRVVLPARAAGYERIVLAGVSQGGFRVLSYAREHGSSIDGAVVIAPFLGPSFYIDDMHRQGGLRSWSPAAQEGWWTTGFALWPTARHIDVIWRWAQRGGVGDVDLRLAWGEHDLFAPAAELLASTLPESHRLATHGGHGWETWRRLWSQFLRDDPYGLVRRGRTMAVSRVWSHGASG